MVYAPREDSWLLARVVTAFAHGRVMDVGTGSGILARTASAVPGVVSVRASDVNPEAVAAAVASGVDAHLADLFSDEALYDTIVCNAPYLPDDLRVPDVALDGGPRGFEWTLRFLDACRSRLSRDGQVLLLVSSHTNPGVIDDWLLRHAFSWEVVARERVFFEELRVYRIVWALPERPSAVFLARGRRSKVYRDGDVVVKVMPEARVSREAAMLRVVRPHGIGPVLHQVSGNRLVLGYVDGERLEEYVSRVPGDAPRVLAEVWRQLQVLDALGVNKQELTRPDKHVLVTASGVVLIDWERARFSPRPQNCAQFAEFLRRRGWSLGDAFR